MEMQLYIHHISPNEIKKAFITKKVLSQTFVVEAGNARSKLLLPVLLALRRKTG